MAQSDDNTKAARTNNFGLHLDTTEETIAPENWAETIRELAPLIGIGRMDGSEHERLREALRQAGGLSDTSTPLDIAEALLGARETERAALVFRLLDALEGDKPFGGRQIWSDYNPPPVAWLIDGWLPAGRVGMLTGEGGRGKSRLALQVASALAGGYMDFLGGANINLGATRRSVNGRGGVVFASWEDPESEIGRRVRAMVNHREECAAWHAEGTPSCVNAEDLDERLHYLDMASEGPLWAPGTGGSRHISTLAEITNAGMRLREYAEDMEACLLILDPLAAVFASNENDRGLVRGFMADWDAWARDTNCAVLLVSHPPKTEGSGYSGSTDWHGASRFRWELDYAETPASVQARDGQGRNGPDAVREPRLRCAKSNYGLAPPDIWLGICDRGVWAERVFKVGYDDAI
ncbi:MAG: AAA family ATPase [Dehalococcoidia bacterium]|nr:AAA family ATPase [Dehalococcoidia bacterium]